MTIDPKTKLVKGMEITRDDCFSGGHFTIVKVARKYATVIPKPYLPGIDNPEKVLIDYIRENCSIDRQFGV